MAYIDLAMTNTIEIYLFARRVAKMLLGVRIRGAEVLPKTSPTHTSVGHNGDNSRNHKEGN